MAEAAAKRLGIATARAPAFRGPRASLRRLAFIEDSAKLKAGALAAGGPVTLAAFLAIMLWFLALAILVLARGPRTAQG